MKFISLNRRRGFTLIEILVVIGIIGVLSSIILASVSSARSQARDKQRIVDLKTAELGLQLYYEANGRYPNQGCGAPTDASKWTGPGPHTGLIWEAEPQAGCDEYIAGLAPVYIPKLPTDPISEQVNGWGYIYRSNGTDYKLIVHGSVEGGVVIKGEKYARCPDLPACTQSYCSQTSYAVYSPGAACW